MPARIAILASGAGTNARALIEASKADELSDGRVEVVVSDRPRAGVLDVAKSAEVEALVLDYSAYQDRPGFCEALADELKRREIGLVCSAGFMRILSPQFVRSFPNRILNTHPSLLPAFPGAHPVKDTLEWGAKVTGATIHFIDEETDHGPIILQDSVIVEPGDDVETLHGRIKSVEHRIFPEAVRLVLSDRILIEGRVVKVKGEPS